MRDLRGPGPDSLAGNILMQRRRASTPYWYLGNAVLVDTPNLAADRPAELPGIEPDRNPVEPAARAESTAAPALTATELRWLHHLAVRRVDRERKRIERDLHDSVQIHLIQMAVKITRAMDALEAPLEQRRETLLELRQQARQALGAVRDVCRGLYPTLLRDRGLVPALIAVADRSDGGLTIRADAHVRALRFAPHVAEHLYFFVHEAVTNAWKHASPVAGAPNLRVEVGLSLESGDLHITIRDNGRGFDPEQTPPGHGRATMEDRLHHLGGSVAIRSQPGQGTVVVGWLTLRPDHLAVAR
jgi:signal transduction histidine kinase